MCRLPDRPWRRIIELFLLAGAHEWSNRLPSVEDMAWELRIDPDELLIDLREVEKTGIIKEIEPGQWIVTNFEKRQDAETSAERVRRYREQKRKQIYKGNDVSNELLHKDVTSNVPELELKLKLKLEDTQTNLDFDGMRKLCETKTGYPIPTTQEDIKALNDFVTWGVIEEDFTDALQFFSDNGRVARGPFKLRNSIQTAVAKRKQKSNGNKPDKQFDPAAHASEVYGEFK